MYMNSRLPFKFIALLIAALLCCGLCACSYIQALPAADSGGFSLPIAVVPSPDLSLQLNKLVPEVSDNIRISGDEFCFCTEEGAVRKLLPSAILSYESSYPKSNFMRAQLSETEQLVYDALLYGAENGYSRVCFSVDGEVDISKCYAFLACDSPFIETNYTLSISKCTVTLSSNEKLYYCVKSSAAEPSRWQKKVLAYAEAQRVVAQMPENCVSSYDKALYLYRYLAKNVEYISNIDYIETGSFLYDALVGFATNCDGYANALSLLLSLCDIECIVVMGDIAATDGVGHAWNMARLDGVWYSLDATYDSAFAKKQETGGRIFYFLTSDTRLSNTSGGYIQEITGYVPACTDTRYERLFVDVDAAEMSDKALAQAFRQAVEAGDGCLVIYDAKLLNASSEAITIRFDEVVRAIDFSVRVGGFGIQDLGLLVLYKIA